MATETERVQLPLADKQLVACRKCHRVLTSTQFASEGCQSCGGEPLDVDELVQNTTSKFVGYVGIVDSSNSWVARLIGCGNVPPGVYAATVTGEEDDDEIDIESGPEGEENLY